MSERFERRRAALRKLLAKEQLQGLLITSFTNVTYLTGFTGDDSYLLVTQKKEILLSDSRFETQLKDECPGLDVMIRTSGVAMSTAVEKAIKTSKISHLGIEGDSMTVGLRERLATQLSGTELVSTAGLVETLRVKKDREEITRIRRAVRQAERAFGILRASLRGDMSERLAACELEHQMRLQGARGASFPTIVAAGARAALPHASPTEALIESAPFVLVDWGANEGLYVSDLTRMIFTGKIPAKMRRIYEVVLEAQLAAIAAIRPGAICREVDGIARGIIDQAGFGRYFGHGLGHGIGLQVHEAPRLGAADTVLEPGMVVTVEPGIYLPGVGGVRIEDDVLVTKDGHEVLTTVPKSLESAIVD